MNARRAARVLGMLWASPCSLVGAVLALGVIASGGSARRAGHTVEVGLSARQAGVPRWARGLRTSAITFGHVIVGQSHEGLAELRAHERVHVRQYEVLGPLFFVAYPLSSLLAWLRGDGAYHGNHFERQAVALAAAAAVQRSAASSAPACVPKA